MTNKKNYIDYDIRIKNRDTKEEHYGKVRVSNKFIRNKERRKRRAAIKRKRLGNTILALTVAGYIGYSLADDIPKVEENISQRIEDYEMDKQKIAYTDYSEDQIKQMPFFDRIALYQDYINYVMNNTEEAMAVNAVVGDVYKLKSEADAQVEELAATMSVLPKEDIKQKESTIISKYMEIMNRIDHDYNHKYSLTSQNEERTLVSNASSRHL